MIAKTTETMDDHTISKGLLIVIDQVSSVHLTQQLPLALQSFRSLFWFYGS